MRDLIYREVLEYHPQAQREYLAGEAPSRFIYPSAVDNFKRQFAYLEAGGAAGSAAGGAGASRELRRQAQSLPREQMVRVRSRRDGLTICQRWRGPDAPLPMRLCRSCTATRRRSTWRAQTRMSRTRSATVWRTACRR